MINAIVEAGIGGQGFRWGNGAKQGLSYRNLLNFDQISNVL